MPALSSDSKSDSEDESEGDSEDEDDIPVHCYGTDKLNPTISRKPADESEDRNFPGCPGIWTGCEEPQDTNTAEYQEELQKLFDILAAEDAAREAAESATLPVRTSTPVRRPEQESSTTATPLEVNTTLCGWTGEVDFESEDEAALLE